MNVSMAIAATLRDADVPAAIIRGVPILARAAGLIAHLAEEAETPIGFYMASQAEEAIVYAGRRGRAGRMSLTEPEIEAAPWEGQARPTTRPIAGRSPISSSARASIATSSRAPASRRPKRSAASPTSPGCRSPRRTNCAPRAAPTSRSERIAPATRDEIVRIYSTSGTTGTPSYIPLTAGDVEVWVRTSARSYARLRGRSAATASSRPTTPVRSSPARRSTPSRGSASVISRSARATPTG